MSIEQFIYAYVAKEENYKDTDIIFKEGTSGNWIYIVLEGRVKVKKTTPKGLLVIDILKEGDIFGEMILWQPGRGTRTESIVADGPVKIGVLDTEFIVSDYERLSPRLKDLMKSLMNRLGEAVQKAATFAVE